MMLKFTGPSYSLATRKADCQRSINVYVKRIESGSGKEDFILEDVPGLDEFTDLDDGPVRGLFTTTQGQTYAFTNTGVHRLLADGTSTLLGPIVSGTNPVEADANTSQMVLVQGSEGYIVTLATDVLTQITAAGFYGSKSVAVIDDYALFVRDDSGQFYLSAIGNAASIDALDFATAESSPDDLTCVVSDHRQARLFGTHTTEGWFNSGATDFPFSRDQSSYSQIGCLSPYTARRASNSVIFVGNSEEGSGVVYMATGNTIQRISTHAVEESIQGSTDAAMGQAFVYQDGGHLFYCLNMPGVPTQWVFDVSSQAWHERVELVDGSYTQHRATCHTYAFEKHLVGAADGKVYAFNRETHTNAGDPLVRRRISPHNAGFGLFRVFYGTFELDVTCGDVPSGAVPRVQMRYSNDGGRTWQEWRIREVGRIGEYDKRVRWNGCGSARDRVWDVQCTDDCAFSIISAKCQEGEGNG